MNPIKPQNTFISMLRGINVGGQNRIAMAALKDLYASLGFSNVVTYVQSGNVVFDCAETDADALGRAIESAIAQTLGLTVPILIRDEGSLRRLIAENPFLTRVEDPTKLHVTFLAAAPTADDLARLAAPAGCTDEFVVVDSEIYLFCPNGYGVTKLSNTFFERKLKRIATTRNWKTVLALYELAQQR